MRKRLKNVTDNGLPRLVALYRGIVVGYCYATPYRPRHAYRFTLEESIYVDASTTGRGFGSALMDALIERCEQGPRRQMIAVVGDGHNNAGSLRLHKKHGFEVVGQLRSVGYKKRRLAGYVDYAAPAQRRRLDPAGIGPVRSGALTPPLFHREREKT